MVQFFTVGDHTLRILEDASGWWVELDGVWLDMPHDSPADAWKAGLERIRWRVPPRPPRLENGGEEAR